MKNKTNCYLKEFAERNPRAAYLLPKIEECVSLLTSLKSENKVFLCGNGGSAADCEHFAGEMLKSFKLPRGLDDETARALADYPDGEKIMKNVCGGVKTIPLTSFTAFTTAFINDCSADYVYAQALNVLAVGGDVLIAISTSGNSANVLYAAELAKAKGLKVVALTGRDGGKLKNYADILLNVPEDEVWKIQEMHLPVYHAICLCAEEELFG